jgi:hypothetical protein
MNTLDTLKAAVAWLSTNIDPAVPRALLVVAVLVVVYAVRKLFPRAWEAFASVVPVPVIDPAPVLLVLSKFWQALPGTLLGMLSLALSTGGDPRATVKGAVFGALAALAHEVMKAVPWVPYRGEVGKTKLPPVLPLLLLMLLGCDPRKPPCDETKLRAVDERYTSRVLAVCLPKHDRKEDCPEWPALEADHRRELREVCPQ